MRKFRFSTDRKNLRVGSSIKLDDFEAKHARQTLRLSKGDEIYIFNGEKEFKAKMKLVTDDAVMAEITEEVDDLRYRNNLQIDLYIGIPKTKIFEEIIEKLTELGVSKFVPVECEYSIIKIEHLGNKYDRWNKIILSACKQSDRIDIPQVTDGVMYSDVFEIIKEESYDKVYFMTLRQNEAVSLGKIQKVKMEKIAIFIGPEGGFSPGEHKLATENGMQFTQIFDSVLRVETAAISSVALIKYLHE